MSKLYTNTITRLLSILFIFIIGCTYQLDEHQPPSEFVSKVKNEIDSISSSIQLQAYLRQIFELGQKYRTEENDVLDRFGHDSKEYKQIWDKINKTNAENLVRVEYLLGKYGYPKKVVVGEQAASAPWYVIHHAASYSDKEKYFHILYGAYIDGNITGNEMDFYLGRMYQEKFGSYFNMPSPYRENNKIDTLIFILELKHDN